MDELRLPDDRYEREDEAGAAGLQTGTDHDQYQEHGPAQPSRPVKQANQLREGLHPQCTPAAVTPSPTNEPACFWRAGAAPCGRGRARSRPPEFRLCPVV